MTKSDKAGSEMGRWDTGFAISATVYILLCMIALSTVIYLKWPDADTGKAASDPNDRTAQRRAASDPNDQTTQRDAASDPNGQTAQQIKRLAQRTEVLLVDSKPMDLDRVYHTTHKVDGTFVLAPTQRPIAGLRLAVLVAAVGALGACLHGATSLAYHHGKRDFGAEWTLWYVYRPFTGGGLAFIFYLVIAGGFVPQVKSDSGGFYGIIGLAGLIGLFSRQAMNKLREIFDVIFAPDKDDSAQGPNSSASGASTPPPNPTPQLDAIDPPDIAQTNQDVKVTLKGNDFVQGAVVKIGSEELKTTHKGEKELIAVIPKNHLAQPGVLQLVVVNPPPGGGTSQPKPVTVK